MNLIKSYFTDAKYYSNPNSALSLTIDWLRLPCAIAVVFIHCFGPIELNLVDVHSEPLSMWAIFNYVRIFFSNILPVFAVPIFFMLSGFLFFYKIDKFDVYKYKQKVKSRFRTIFVPYLLWIILYISFLLSLNLIKGYINGDKSLSDLWNIVVIFFQDNGGMKIFWNSCVWGQNYINILGKEMLLSGPILIPLWFLRDLMVVILFTPLIYIYIKKLKSYGIILLYY